MQNGQIWKLTFFLQATVEGVLKSQIAQSQFLTQEEKRFALKEQKSYTGQDAKTVRARAILVSFRHHTETSSWCSKCFDFCFDEFLLPQISNISITGVEVRANSSLLLKIRVFVGTLGDLLYISKFLTYH